MIETIGQKLRQEREARSLNLEQVAKATRIRVHYLQALEAGNFESLPSRVQARGFLRSYADYLDLDARTLLAELDGEMVPEVIPVPEAPAMEAQISEALEERPETIFAEVGQKLKRQRELLGLSYEDVERHTHLREHNLRALEAGQLEELPSPVQARGMLSNYAAFLGLDPDPLLLRFADGLQAGLVQKQMAQPVTRAQSTRRASKLPISVGRLFSGELLVGGLIILFLVGFVSWAALRIFTLRSGQEPLPTAPSIAEVLLATPSATGSPTPIPATPTIPVILPPTDQPDTASTEEIPGAPTSGEAVLVYLTVQQRAWIRVLVDGEIVLSGRVLPGTAYNFTGDERVEILTGNAAALQVFYNQQDLGTLGLYGEVVNRVFTLEGIQTPTPTVTLTPTLTPRPTRTPPGTASP